MTVARAAGVLLHPTSLPGPYGIGDLGPEAHRWLAWLGDAGLSLWQVLPLGPTGYGDSPYQCFSAFAGNPLLVSPELLMNDRLLDAADLGGLELPEGTVDFGTVISRKGELLRRAHRRFRSGADPPLRREFEAFASAQAGWLEDYALFIALKQEHGGRNWVEWDPALTRRDPKALAAARERLGERIEAERFVQFLFFRQWGALRDSARARGIRLIGDAPIFVAHDSADVWAHPGLFQLSADGRMPVVAGVPPDLFSATGQRWGNPLYRWEVMRRDGYAWWIARVKAMLEQVDAIRLDHFIGFTRAWEVPAGAATAEAGRWRPGPGAEVFRAMRAALGRLPIIAEDLGLITPEVVALREELGLPGMKVLQFAFGDGDHNPFLPHHHVPGCVVYTGTHDNDTTRAWFDTAGEATRDHARRYLQSDDRGIVRAVIRAAFASVAATALVPLQDVLELGSEGRMNLPGRPSGNWSWRFRWDQLTGERQRELRELSHLHGRCPATTPAVAAPVAGAAR